MTLSGPLYVVVAVAASCVAAIAVVACSSDGAPSDPQDAATTVAPDASDDVGDGTWAWDSGVEATTCYAQEGGCTLPGFWVNCTAEPELFVPPGCASTTAQDKLGWVSFCCGYDN